MLERELQDQVIQYAKMRGYLVHHDLPSQRASGRWSTHSQGDSGFPDLVLAKAGRFLVVELKSATGSVKENQRAWLDAIEPGTTVEKYVWRPKDFDYAVKVLDARDG